MSELTKIEEILTEAGTVGLRSRTIESAYNILNRNPNIDRVSAYTIAFETLISNTESGDDRDLEFESAIASPIPDTEDYLEDEESDSVSQSKFDLFGEINLELLQTIEITDTEIPVVITVDNIENKYLTKYKKISEKTIDQEPRIGIINGLWANLLGMGGIIPVQTSFFPSSIFLDLKLNLR